MVANFNSLSTEKFRVRMRPAAEKIYSRIFPGCRLEDLRENGIKVHILDKEFGIDSLLHLPSKQWITVQEKYRSNEMLKYGDFTQEYKNACGTPHESDGEWFKLGAQLYFYGWANKDETAFEKWYLLDIAKYKLTVEKQGGLQCVGTLRQNSFHGRASFYAIPFNRISKAIILSSETLDSFLAFKNGNN